MSRAVPLQRPLNGKIECGVCPHHCRIGAGRSGICRVRFHDGRQLLAGNYGALASCHLDPVEKKPLYHFWPGSTLLSVGSYGCSFKCGFCQNWSISQAKPDWVAVAPDWIVSRALADQDQGCAGIAFTYSEPLMWYEFVVEAAAEAREQGLATVLVTNGFASERAWEQLLPVTSAVNIDIKSMDPAFYRRHCHGRLSPVLEAVQEAHQAGVHVEITNLLIPGLNDSDELIDRLAAWLADISPDIPLHLTRYFPAYRFTRPPTPGGVVTRARDRAARYLRYTFTGNMAAGSDTGCWRCGRLLIKRGGWRVVNAGLDPESRTCLECGEPIAIAGTVPLVTSVREG